MDPGASERPVFGDGVTVKCAAFSVTVSGVAGRGRRPTLAHQAMKAAMSEEYIRRVESVS